MQSRSRLFPLLLLDAITRFLALAILPRAAISLDLQHWNVVASFLLNGVNPYQATTFCNHPPIWNEILYALAKLSVQSGLGFLLYVRLFLIASDLALLAAVYYLLRALYPLQNVTRLLAVGYCLNPLLILLTVQHGNFDSLCMIGVVSFLYFLHRFALASNPIDWLCAAACLGLAVSIKQFALVLCPLLASGSRRLDRRFRILGPFLLLAPATFSLAPLYVLAPDAITQNVLEYRSFGNTFGLAGLLFLAGEGRFHLLFSQIFTALVLLISIIIAFAFWRRPWAHRATPVLLAAMIFLALFTFGPGYGTQYWFWVLPLILVCYPNCDRSLQRIILATMLVIIPTNVFEYAVEQNLGRFLYCIFPSPGLLRLDSFFQYPSVHLTLLRLPESLAAMILFAALPICLRQPRAPQRSTLNSPDHV